MRFAAVQFDIVWEDKPANHSTIERMLAEAGLAPGTFVLLPELADTGFSMNIDRIVDDRSVEWATALAQRLGVFVQHGFAQRQPARHGGSSTSDKGRNCAAIFASSGDLIARYEKVHPFSYGREAQHYNGGEHLTLVRCGGTVICPLICYDLRFPELWRLAALAGAEVFTIGANWPEARQLHWRSLVIARAIENQAYVVAVNRTGSDPHLRYAGGSIMVSPKGEIIAEAADEPAVLTAELDVPALRRWRSEFPALSDVHRSLLGSVRIEAAQESSPAGQREPVSRRRSAQ